MKMSNFKFKVKPLEIVIVVVAIIVISTSIILIKNHVKQEEINNLSIADKTNVVDGDTVIQVNNTDLQEMEINSSNNGEKTDKDNQMVKIVIKKGSTAVLQIPSLGIIAQVTEGSDAGTLKNYVGVVEGSARPGQVGNYSLAAHNNIDTEIFRNLHKIEIGALVNVYTQSKMYTYKINEKYNVKPTDTGVLKSSDKKEITLITCNYNASERIIVKGTLVSEKMSTNVTGM